MDAVPPSKGQTRAAAIRRAASDCGITPDDPFYHLIDHLAELPPRYEDAGERVVDGIREAGGRAVGEIRGAKDEFVGGLGQVMREAHAAAGGQVARNVAAAVPAALDRLVLQRVWRLLLAGAGIWCVTMAGLYWWMDYTSAKQNDRLLDDLRAQMTHVQADLNAAIVNHNTANWLALIRMNGMNGAINNPQDCKVYDGGGVACSYVFWTKPPTPNKPQ